MKRVRCPKCDEYTLFDETKYSDGQSLVFQCAACGKQFGIRLGTSKLHQTRREEAADGIVRHGSEGTEQKVCAGSIVVIENVFHYKQVLPLSMGDNSIGRYTKGCRTALAIETNDPSMDINHCVINVSRTPKGGLKHTLRDGPSLTGTFVDNELLGPRERRTLDDGTLFTIGATSIILRTSEEIE